MNVAQESEANQIHLSFSSPREDISPLLRTRVKYQELTDTTTDK